MKALDPLAHLGFVAFLLFDVGVRQRFLHFWAIRILRKYLQNHAEKPDLTAYAPDNLLRQIKSKVAAQFDVSEFQLNIIPPDTVTENFMVKVDADRLFQIMINLVDNAIKFADNSENKTIDIGLKLSSRGKQAIYFVRDYGPGIDKNQMKKIFRLFYRSGDELTRTKPGTGIGLALVAQLAGSMRAKVDVLNRQPGAEFQLILELFTTDFQIKGFSRR